MLYLDIQLYIHHFKTFKRSTTNQHNIKYIKKPDKTIYLYIIAKLISYTENIYTNID